MDKFRVQGPAELQGEVTISGTKNAVLPILFAALLAGEPVEVQDVLKLKGVDTSMGLLSQLGTKVERNGPVYTDARSVNVSYAPYDLVRAVRASIWALGPLVTRFGQRQVSLPGGCTIDACPVGLHISGLEQLDATVKLEEGYVKAPVDGCLKGAHIVMDKVNVGVTATTIYAVTLAEGTTITEDAARGPETVDTASFLIMLGTKISGQSTDRIIIEGVERLGDGVYRVLPDRIGTDTFLAAATISHGEIICRGTQSDTLDAVLAKLRDAGADIEVGEDWINLDMHDRRPKTVNVRTAPHPAFPTDMQAQFTLSNLMAKGTGFTTEVVSEDRFTRVPGLSRMGAHTEIEGNTIIYHSVEKLSGVQVIAANLRTSASLVLAGCIAEETTVVDRIYRIGRDYKHIEDELRALGVNIERAEDKQSSES